MWKTWAPSLGWEDCLEKGKATHSNILAWRIPCTVHGIAKNWTRLSDVHFFTSSTKYGYKYFIFINATSYSPMHYKVDILIYPYFASELTDAKRD